jgi:Galactosyltransferase.
MVIEQADGRAFNKGALLNVGFSLVEYETACVCFHDVDMLPIDDPSIYAPVTHTTHLAGRVEQFQFELPYPEYFGGVFMSPPREFRTANGFSNAYWGWGGEDDELFIRFQLAGISIERKNGQFRSLPHERSAHSLENNVLLMKSLAALGIQRLDEIAQDRIATIQKKYLDTFGVHETQPRDYRADGLSTLSYDRHERSTLLQAYPMLSNISKHHELVRVWL